jgi:tetratricopeptide (TPR) repeat protein
MRVPTETQLKRLNEPPPTHPSFHNHELIRKEIQLYRITCLAELHRFEEAEEVALGAIKHADQSASASIRFTLAGIRASQGRLAESLALYREVLQCLPDPRLSDEDVSNGIQVVMTRMGSRGSLLQ